MIDTKLPVQDSPPSYLSLQRENSSSALPPLPTRQGNSSQSPALSSGNSILNPTTPQHVNQFSLYSKQDAISGQFVIDPALERTNKFIRHKSPVLKKNRKFFHRKVLPHAVFATRSGDITVDLAIKGSHTPQRTYIQTGSREGTIRVVMSPIPPQNHVCLEAHTKRSNIIVLIPSNFDGALQFRSHRANNVSFLPEFAQRARVVHGSDKESLVLFGNNDLAITDPKSISLDLCLLSSHMGQIVVGVAGVDQYEEPKPPVGLWQRLMGTSRRSL